MVKTPTNVRPIINPVLRLTSEPRSETPPTGGKGRKQIITKRLKRQSIELSRSVREIQKLPKSKVVHAEMCLLFARMFKDSLSPTYTPDDIFDEKKTGSKLNLAFKDGFIVETNYRRLNDLDEDLRNPKTIKEMVDVSRLKTVRHFNPHEDYLKSLVTNIWDKSHSFQSGDLSKKSFGLWLLPYSDGLARQNVSNKLESLLHEFKFFEIGFSRQNNEADHIDRKKWTASWGKMSQDLKLQIALGAYLQGRDRRLSFSLTKLSQLKRIAASGTVVRIAPIAKISSTETKTKKVTPPPPVPIIGNNPIVGVVNGGC